MSTGTQTTTPDILAMSDDDFLKMGVPPAAPAQQAAAEPPAQAEPPVQAAAEEEPLVEGEQPPEEEEAEASAAEVNPLERPDSELGDAPPIADPAKAAEAKPGEEKPAVDPAKVADPAADPAAGGIDYKALYEKLMAPLKANGKTIDLRNPEELIQLAQMGANYTRKLQELAPHRKVLMMLENNGLLDEGKLSFLIDLDKKNPEAIKKLIKDAGVDPMEIDTSVEPVYTEGNHRVSDAHVNFQAALDELSSNPEGQKTLVDIDARWDQASKEALWNDPGIMSVIHSQRESGIYAQITEEMDRLRTLGQIPSNVSFLQAYQAVGNQLSAAGRFGTPVAAPAQDSATAPAAPVVATRVAAPKPSVKNGDQASAASPSRSAARKAPTDTVNPLTLSDADFMKQYDNFRNRL